MYKNQDVGKEFCINILVEKLVVEELTSAIDTTPIDEAQLLSHLNLIGSPKGLLVNFNVKKITQNIISRVTNY